MSNGVSRMSDLISRSLNTKRRAYRVPSSIEKSKKEVSAQLCFCCLYSIMIS